MPLTLRGTRDKSKATNVPLHHCFTKNEVKQVKNDELAVKIASAKFLNAGFSPREGKNDPENDPFNFLKIESDIQSELIEWLNLTLKPASRYGKIKTSVVIARLKKLPLRNLKEPFQAGEINGAILASGFQAKPDKDWAEWKVKVNKDSLLFNDDFIEFIEKVM